ncbi:type I-E CRISPR-associated protein Cas7/Cse4/CasC [Lawsonella clevelandensis]|uniref:type I-E CRISPR-associated protein Cas7/Cse4/CasC n=1 Tax=Lawsonella clevelandensis TaxID=1528099 RepID=UPI002915ACAF|nr:type I-E CRISPR-associated protein Cas7/Cse4/CasC [Lawsonella clevelandensis]MDU7193013.1 type I-E CRISPR-associated protein Cas7/Cse4/CasC [Lawsonella clevelandensis]
MTLIVDIHALHTVPPSLINRDDTGAPKTAVFGGVPRQRVSSQSWKRAIRQYMEQNIDSSLVGFRSKKLPGKIAELVQEQNPGWPVEQVIQGVENLFKAAGIKLEKPKKSASTEDDCSGGESYPETGYLLFLSPHQITRAAEIISQNHGEKIDKKDAKSILDTEHSVDVAMFGRMLADAPSYNVDAAVQVAHAISVHGTEPEFDYFTAVDDIVEDAEEAGAGMIGTVQMMSSTLYRYATINVDGLAHNLGSKDAASEAVGYFLQAFTESLPTGKINTFANQTLPELVYVAIRDTRPVSLVNAFEEAVTSDEREGKNRREVAAEKMAQEEKHVEETYGFVPKASFVVALGTLGSSFAELSTSTTMTTLSAQVQEALRAE